MDTLAVEKRTGNQLLAEFAAAREEEAFAELVRRHSPLVFSVCRRVLGSTQDAEDAAQAVFLTLARKAGELATIKSLDAWLHRVAWRVAYDLHKQNCRRRRHEEEARAMAPRLPAVSAQPDGQDELWLWLDREVDALPAKYRLPIVLHHLQGRTKEETARLLAEKEGTISMRLVRGREMLKDRLAHRGVVLSVGLLAALVSKSSLAAEVPTAFAGATAKAACLLAGGNLAAGGLVSQKVVLLEKGARKMLFMAKLKVALLATVVVCAIGTGAGAAAWRVWAEEKPEAHPSAEPKPASGADVVDNATARFFGAGQRFSLSLDSVHGLWGGVAVRVESSGECDVRVVSPAKTPKEKHFSFKLEPGDAAAFRKICIASDLVALKIKDRPGVPDEGRPKIILKNDAGQTFEIAKWSNDQVAEFDSVLKALAALAAEAAAAENAGGTGKSADSLAAVRKAAEARWHQGRKGTDPWCVVKDVQPIASSRLNRAFPDAAFFEVKVRSYCMGIERVDHYSAAYCDGKVSWAFERKKNYEDLVSFCKTFKAATNDEALEAARAVVELARFRVLEGSEPAPRGVPADKAAGIMAPHVADTAAADSPLKVVLYAVTDEEIECVERIEIEVRRSPAAGIRIQSEFLGAAKARL